MRTLIKKQTAADDAEHYFRRCDVGCALQVTGDLGTDTIPVYFFDPEDNTDTGAYDNDGELLVLSQTNPAIPIHHACHIHVDKPTTTNAVGVKIAGLGL